jgi:hypothetical protein
MRFNSLVALILLALTVWATGCRNETAVEPPSDVEPAGSPGGQAPAGEPANRRWHRYVPRALSEAGVYHWQYPIDQRGMTQDALVATGVVCGPLGAYVPLAGEPGRRGVALLPADLAAFDNPDPTWVHKSPLPVLVAPQTDGERLAYVDGSPGEEGRRLRIVGAEGRRAWEVPVADSASGAFAVSSQGVLVQDEPEQFALYHAGKQVWRESIGTTEKRPLIWGNRAWIATNKPPALAGVDLHDGSQVKVARLAAAPTTAPVAGGDRVLVGTEAGVAAYVEGEPVREWSIAPCSVASDLAVSPHWVAFVTADEELAVLRREDGTVVCGELPAARSCAPLVFDNGILFVAGEALMTISTSSLSAGGEQPQPTRWADISWLGPSVADMVCCRQHVYVPLEGWGLVRFGDLEE